MYKVSHKVCVTFAVLSIFIGTTLFIPHAGFAQTSPASREALTPQLAQQVPEGKFIQNLGNQAIALTVDKSLTPEQLDAKYNNLIGAAFDMKEIGKFVLGRIWFRAAPIQQQEYLKLFQELVLRTYGSRLRLYSGEKFNVTAVRPQSAQDTVVNSEIIHPNGEAPTALDWIVRHENGDKLAIVDVSVDGVSQSVTQRDEFASILADNGGDINALLSELRQKVQQGAAANNNN